MSTASFTCPEDSNSTDCLLRAVLLVLEESRDGNSKFDWDPITFAFTLVLGLAATALAIITIAQGVMSARKGFRKAGRSAIEDWSNYTTSKWTWAEMSYQYTVWTPIIRQDSLVEWASDLEDAAVTTDNDAFWNFKTPRAAAATWISFFQITGLARIIKAPPQSKSRSQPRDLDGLYPVAADFLPDDIVAAPAYAKGAVVIVAAAATGIQRWTFAEDLPESPVILGNSFQFDFRQHPILGLVGSFSPHEKKGTRQALPSPRLLKSTMQYALGTVQVLKTPGFNPKSGLWAVDLVSDSNNCKTLMRTVAKVSSSSEIHPGFSVPSEALQQHVDPNHCFFKADRPELAPALFPISSSKLPKSYSLTILALVGSYWATANLGAITAEEMESWGSNSVLPSWERFYWGCDERLDEQGREYIRGNMEVLKMCLKHITEPSKFREWFAEAGPAAQKDFRVDVLEQLRQVDKWLYPKDKPEICQDAESRTAVVYKTYLLLLHAERLTKNGVFDNLGLDADPENATGTRHDRDTARNRNFRLIHALRKLLDALNLSQGTLKASSLRASGRCYGEESREREIVDGMTVLQHRGHLDTVFHTHKEYLKALIGLYFDAPGAKYSTHLTLDRLGVVVVCNSDKEDNWRLWERWWTEKVVVDENTKRTVDDVIIYRYILVVLLFETAFDNSKVLESALWDRVIPIL